MHMLVALLLPALAILSTIEVQAATVQYKPEAFSIPEPLDVKFSDPLGGSAFAEDPKMYLFPVTGKKNPYAFVNEMGQLEGFDVDLMNAVCALVGKKCKIILGPFPECIFTYKDIDYAGNGLMSGWYDGCTGESITVDRMNVVDFTLPYLATSGTFTVAPGNPSKFDPSIADYSDFRLIRLSGAPTNDACLTRLRKKAGTFLIASGLDDAKQALLNGTADVLFSPRQEIDGLETLPMHVHCEEGGVAMLLKKGSTIPSWWNPAFQTFYFSGKYASLCQNAAAKYGRPVQCLPAPADASPELLRLMSAPQDPLPTERMWKFVVSGKIEPFSFLDEQGMLIGWTKDFIDEVCRRAGKRCILTLAKVEECTFRNGELLYPGRGMLENWFDACTGYFETFDRDISWDFTMPYLISNASFYVKPGNPSGFDPSLSDYSKFRLVHADTAITNDHCLNRLHKKFNVLLDAPVYTDAIEMVLNGTADAWFTKRVGVQSLEQLPGRFHCENVGTSVMTKKGSELPIWWNKAFQEFYLTGEFNQFCKDKGVQYNYDFPCVPPPVSLD